MTNRCAVGLLGCINKERNSLWTMFLFFFLFAEIFVKIYPKKVNIPKLESLLISQAGKDLFHR